MVVRGVKLNQRQEEAVKPILDARVNLHHMSRARFEAKCVAAMAAAGCPLVEDLSEVSKGDLFEVKP